MGYFAIASLGNSAFAQITPDSTLPGEPSVLTPSVIINDLLSDRIDGGAIRGANLFHSFLQFNIGNGEQVYFANPPGIENILGRVTGTEPSNILGTLGVTGGDANLFLINQTVANLGPVLAPQVFDNVAPGSSGLFANTSADSNAEGGDIKVSTRDLFVRNEAQVTVNNQGSGSAGNLQIKASRDIQLRNQGSITAETRSGGGGNITLDVGGFLLLLRNSEISTTAGTANAGGNGGDIIINTHSDIIAAPANNNDIKANAFTGTGGNIQITAAALRAIARRPLNLKTNDINASSTLGIDGLVTTSSTLNVDPTQSLTNLPQTPVDASRLLAQNCPARGRSSSREENKFTITGRGGLPPNPNDTLQSESVVTPWVTLEPPVENRMGNATSTNPNSSALASSVPKTPTYAEAQGWIISEKGEIILTAQASTVTPHNPALTPATFCNGS